MNRCRHAVNSYTFAYGKHIFGAEDGLLYELDFDTYTDEFATGDRVIQRMRRTANIHGGLYGRPGAELIFERVEFDVEAGVGITTGQGSDPKLMIRYSDDGGRTWSPEQHYSLGAGGDYSRRVVLTQQGRAFNRVYELSYSEPTRFSLIGASGVVEFAV